MTLLEAFSKFIRTGDYENAFQTVTLIYGQDKILGYDLCKRFRAALGSTIRMGMGTEEMMDLMKQAYKLSARDYLDDFCVYMEWNRPKKAKFYAPRRKQLLPVVHQLQRLADGEINLLAISMPPGTGKSGLAMFFIDFLAGRNPKDGMICSSHNASFLHGMYDEFVRELDPAGEYLWNDIFGLKVARTNSNDMKIDVDKAQRFSTIQLSSIGSGNAGKIRAVQLLYCDDLIEGIEEALSKERLDKKWQLYNTDLRQRKQGDCRELHIATRWSTADIIGRLEEHYEGDEKAVFLAVPALDAEGKSNFDYGGSLGFTTEMYEDIRGTMDDVSWRALYMNQPIEREGLLYDISTLNRYYELPDGEPDAVLAVCDTAEGRGDDTVLPVFYVYGNKHYMVDCICTDALPETSDPLCAEILVKHGVQRCQFESNAAGGRTADKVEEIVKRLSAQKQIRPCHITKKRTLTNKETKILVNSTFVKEQCYFLDEQKIARGSMYSDFLKKLCSYTTKGKNKHDDVPDTMAQYALFTTDFVGNVAKLVKRPF